MDSKEPATASSERNQSKQKTGAIFDVSGFFLRSNAVRVPLRTVETLNYVHLESALVRPGGGQVRFLNGK